MLTYAGLLTTNAREQWEKCFEAQYIQPVLTVSGTVSVVEITPFFLSLNRTWITSWRLPCNLSSTTREKVSIFNGYVIIC